MPVIFASPVQINQQDLIGNMCLSFRHAHTKTKPEQKLGFVKQFEMKDICKCKCILLW